MAMDKLTEQKQGIALKIRVAQAISAGIFTFGLAGMTGDMTGSLGLPISSFSITTTLFGMMGMLVCDIFARKFE